MNKDNLLHILVDGIGGFLRNLLRPAPGMGSLSFAVGAGQGSAAFTLTGRPPHNKHTLGDE
jgi:hypothetical protein